AVVVPDELGGVVVRHLGHPSGRIWRTVRCRRPALGDADRALILPGLGAVDLHLHLAGVVEREKQVGLAVVVDVALLLVLALDRGVAALDRFGVPADHGDLADVLQLDGHFGSASSTSTVSTWWRSASSLTNT